MATLDELIEVLHGAGEDLGPVRATSVRLPERVHRAVVLASELGMDASFTAATVNGLLDRVHAFVRQQALADHLARHPEDQPSLAAVVLRRVDGSDHPAVDRPEFVRRTADRVEARWPDWAMSGRVDEAVERVLEHVELLVDGVATTGSVG